MGGTRSKVPACPVGVVAPTGNCAWYDPAKPDPLHLQSVTYDKANESLDLLLKYTDEKVRSLRELAGRIQSPTISSTDKTDLSSQLTGALGPFCGSGEDAVTCFARYERFTLLNMDRMRAAEIQNDTAAANLMSRQVNKDTHATVGSDVPTAQILLPDGATPTRSKPIVTYMPSYDELQAMYKTQHKTADGVMHASVSNEFAEWLQNTQSGYAAPPDPKDFPLFKKILRDPDNPSAGYFSVLDMGPDGKTPKVDAKAYAAAVYSYQGAKPGSNRLVDDAKTMWNQHFSNVPGKDIGKLNIVPAHVDPMTGDLIMPQGTLSRDAFGDARNSLVNSANSIVGAPPVAGRSPSGAGAHAGTASGLGIAGAAAPGTAAANPLDGNTKIVQPLGGSQNQSDTYTIRMPLSQVGAKVSAEIKQDIPAAPADTSTYSAPIPAVDLPPGADD